METEPFEKHFPRPLVSALLTKERQEFHQTFEKLLLNTLNPPKGSLFIYAELKNISTKAAQWPC